MIERHITNYSVDLYCRLIKALAEREFFEDPVFWDQFAFKYVFYDPRTKGDKVFSPRQAKKLWDTYILLKLRFEALDVSEVLSYVEQFMAPESSFEVDPALEEGS
jgi:hypothetical protein